MNDLKNKVLQTLEKAIPNMPGFELGYILGKAELYATMEGGEKVEENNAGTE